MEIIQIWQWGDETRNNTAGARIIKPFKTFKSNENC